MGWKKRDFVTAAFEEIGYASYVYDLMPEQMQSALRALDSMMATWDAKGISVGYPLSSSPELGEDTQVPDYANEAIYSNLAIRLAPRFGKIVQQETKQIAKQAYNALLSKATFPPEMQYDANLPSGAGNKSIDKPFVSPPVDSLLAGEDGPIEFN